MSSIRMLSRMEWAALKTASSALLIPRGAQLLSTLFAASYSDMSVKLLMLAAGLFIADEVYQSRKDIRDFLSAINFGMMPNLDDSDDEISTELNTATEAESDESSDEEDNLRVYPGEMWEGMHRVSLRRM